MISVFRKASNNFKCCSHIFSIFPLLFCPIMQRCGFKLAKTSFTKKKIQRALPIITLVTPVSNDVIGWIGKSNRAARVAHTLVQYRMRGRSNDYKVVTISWIFIFKWHFRCRCGRCCLSSVILSDVRDAKFYRLPPEKESTGSVLLHYCTLDETLRNEINEKV